MVNLRTFIGAKAFPWLLLTARPDGTLTGGYARSDAPAIECQVLEGQMEVRLPEWGSPLPGEGARLDRAVGSFHAPCWLQGDSAVSLATITLKGTFDLPVRRSVLACAP